MSIPQLIPVTPYRSTNNLDAQAALLDLKDLDFQKSTYREGSTVLTFFNCRIIGLEIRNKEIINYPEVTIFFHDCFISDLKIEEIESKNISLHFHGSVVSGKIKSHNLLAAEASNCLSQSLFFTDVPTVRITYTMENFDNDHWQDLFQTLGIKNIDATIASPIRYSIINATRFLCTSNFPDKDRDRFMPEIDLRFSQEGSPAEVLISSISIPSLMISGNPEGSITLENVRINSWFIYHFYPKGQVTFHDIEPISDTAMDVKIGIHRAVLDQVEFDNVSFDRYPIISFFSTKFSKAIFTSCDFPENYSTFSNFLPIKNVHYPNDRQKNHDKAQYEIFLSLKKALDNTGNYYESQKMQAISHEALRRVKGLSCQDKVILCVNNFSNEHGLSVLRPFLGFFLFSIPLYILYLLSLGRIFNNTDIDWTLFGKFFGFVDITHRNDFLVDKSELTGWSFFVDYAGKLVVGFFIYQFVASFRKYGKK